MGISGTVSGRRVINGHRDLSVRVPCLLRVGDIARVEGRASAGKLDDPVFFLRTALCRLVFAAHLFIAAPEGADDGQQDGGSSNVLRRCRFLATHAKVEVEPASDACFNSTAVTWLPDLQRLYDSKGLRGITLFMLRSRKGWQPVAELLQLYLSR